MSSTDDEDVISSLPDAVLCHIISFLPTTESVATSVLSKRWTDLWRSITTLSFTDLEFNDLETCFHFNEFVYSVLLACNTSIKSFVLDIWYDDPDLHELVFPNVIKWIKAVIQRGVECLHLNINSMGYISELPVCILSCKTLVVLKFRRFLVTDISSIRLPSLKVLDLENVVFLNVRDFLLLLDGCPILEDLEAVNPMFESEDSLTFQERKSLSLSKLTRAVIFFRDCHFPLTALHNVEFLCIEIDKIYRPNDEIPTFHKLNHLELHSLNCNWQLLVQVLNHCPNLQKLHLSEASMTGVRDDVVQESWVDPECVPHCLSSNLRTCTLVRFIGLQGELMMAKYILKNARVLQTMTIRGPPPEDYILGRVRLSHVDFHYIERELSSFPRASATCQLSVIHNR